MSDINVVPYIDVMLVLLIIFMVAAPLIQPGQIDLPSVGQALNRQSHRRWSCAPKRTEQFCWRIVAKASMSSASRAMRCCLP